jgi:hypothetical protein
MPRVRRASEASGMAKTTATTAVLTAICKIEEEICPQLTARGTPAVAGGPHVAAAAVTSTFVAAKTAPVERRSSSCDGRILVATETSVVEKVQLESRPARGARTRRASIMAGEAETIPISTPRARRASTRAAQDLPTSTRKITLSTNGQTEDGLLTASTRKRTSSTSGQTQEDLTASTRKRILSTSGHTEDGLLTASTRKGTLSTSGQTEDGLLTASTRKRRQSNSGQTQEDLTASTRKGRLSTSGQTVDSLLTASTRKRRLSTRGQTDGPAPAGHRRRRFASADLLAGAGEDEDREDDLAPLDEVAEELEAMTALVAETAGSICRDVDPSSSQQNSSLPLDSCSKSISCSPTSSTSTSSTCSWLEELYEAEWFAEQARLTAASPAQLPAARSSSQLPPDQADAYLSAIKDFQKETAVDKRQRISADFMAEVVEAVEREGEGGKRALLLEWARLAYACVFLTRRIQQKKTMPEII